MQSDSKRESTPKLRFPEFNNEHDWEVKPVGALFSERQEAGLTDLPLLSLTDKEGVIPQENTNRRNTSSLDKSKYLRVVPGDVAYNTMRMWEGRSAYVVLEGLVSPAYTVCKPKAGSNGLFFSYYFKTKPVIKQLRRFSQGLVKDTLSLKFETFSRISIASPGLREQQKVAFCLASLDEVIAAQARKVAALKAQKKGLMQQLFPREGESMPDFRFPEFRDSPEWRDRELGRMTTKVGSGITPLGGHTNYKTSGRPFIRSQNVGWGELILNDVAFIDEATHASFSSSEIATSDVLLNITGASIGRSAVADAGIAGGNVNQHVCIIRVEPNELKPVFLNQYLISEHGQKQVNNFQAGGNRQGLNFAQIKSFHIPLPPTGNEQDRIANCLSSLDDLVATEAKKLDVLKIHKNGLMQQLFPAPEEGL